MADITKLVGEPDHYKVPKTNKFFSYFHVESTAKAVAEAYESQVIECYTATQLQQLTDRLAEAERREAMLREALEEALSVLEFCEPSYTGVASTYCNRRDMLDAAKAKIQGKLASTEPN